MTHYLFRNLPHGMRRDGSKLNTKTHFDYISREGEYAEIPNRKEDLVYATSGNMPQWADNPGDFWQEAENNRRANGRAYREFTLGLQEELSLEENIQLVERLLAETGIKDNHAYSYAIHDKIAALDKNHRNIHCHLMFNERNIEKERPVSKDIYFKRFSLDKEGNPVGGYKTNRNWISKETNALLRKKWADIVNEKFKEKGLPNRVSEQSLTHQYQEAQKAGDDDSLVYLNREPPPHLGVAYRNPSMLDYLHKREREYEEKIANLEDINFTEEIPSIKNDKVKLVALDNVVRRTARQIQQRRLKWRKEVHDLECTMDDEHTKNNPMIITVGDLTAYAKEQQCMLEELKDSQMERYLGLKKQIISPKRLEIKAKDMLEQAIHADARNLDDMIKKLEQENERIETLARNEYKRIKKLDIDIKKLQGIGDKLNNLDPYEIIISEKLPNVINLRSKIYGTIPIFHLDSVTKNNETFYLLDENKHKAQAVKLGDEIIKGKACVYDVTFDKNGKVESVIKTDEMMPLYRRNNFADVLDSREKCASNRDIKMTSKIAKITEEALKTEEMPKLHCKWYDDEKEIGNEIDRVEQELERDWSI